MRSSFKWYPCWYRYQFCNNHMEGVCPVRALRPLWEEQEVEEAAKGCERRGGKVPRSAWNERFDKIFGRSMFRTVQEVE